MAYNCFINNWMQLRPSGLTKVPDFFPAIVTDNDVTSNAVLDGNDSYTRFFMFVRPGIQSYLQDLGFEGVSIRTAELNQSRCDVVLRYSDGTMETFDRQSAPINGSDQVSLTGTEKLVVNYEYIMPDLVFSFTHIVNNAEIPGTHTIQYQGARFNTGTGYVELLEAGGLTQYLDPSIYRYSAPDNPLPAIGCVDPENPTTETTTVVDVPGGTTVVTGRNSQTINLLNSVATQQNFVHLTRDEDGRTFISTLLGQPVNWNFIAPGSNIPTIEWVDSTYQRKSYNVTDYQDPGGAYVFTDLDVEFPPVVRVDGKRPQEQ